MIRFETGKSGIHLDTLARLVVHGLGLDWSQFMASTGPARDVDLHVDPDAAVHLSRAEAAQVRRWLASVAKMLRQARRRARADHDPA